MKKFYVALVVLVLVVLREQIVTPGYAGKAVADSVSSQLRGGACCQKVKLIICSSVQGVCESGNVRDYDDSGSVQGTLSTIVFCGINFTQCAAFYQDFSSCG